jgi:cytochrome P450
MRHTIHRWFTPRAVERWRDDLQALISQLIEARRADGGMDLKEGFATRIPLLAICWMLGVPATDAPGLRDLAADALEGGTGPDRMRIAVGALRQLQDYFNPLIDARSREPGEDLISMLADGEQRGIFTREQCLANVIHLMVAGHETTIDLICNGVLALIRNPDQWDLLRSAPDELAASTTEECLRYDPSLKLLQRVAARDVELGNRLVKAGDQVLWIIASANRDPEAFPDPDSFDVSRTPNPHVAFGGGIHHCIGAALARMEGREAFKSLAQTFPRLTLQTEDVEYRPSLVLRGVVDLPVAWD